MSVPLASAASVARVAALLGDESRAAMCLALLDGGRWTVGELAETASVGRATASEHVARLEEGGLVGTETQGRHKYVRLAGPRVAALVERLAGFGEPEQPRSLNAAREQRHFAAARTCYDHLAGRLGVGVHDALVGHRLLRRDGGLALTPRGRDWFTDLGVDLDALERQRRTFLRDCVDLTERRPHLAGLAGAALCEAFLDHDWVRRRGRSRAVQVTPLGERALADRLGLSPADLAVG